MAKRTCIEDRKFIESVEVPAATETYTPVKHSKAIDIIEDNLKTKGFSIKSEEFKINQDGNVVIGFLELSHDIDDDLKPTIIFQNSYNKQYAFRCSAGLKSMQNGNIFILGDSIYGNNYRKHTGPANEVIEKQVTHICNKLESDFKKLLIQKAKLQEIMLDRSDIFMIVSEMYLDRKNQLLTDSQASTVRKELKNYKLNEITGWILYNILVKSIMNGSCRNYMDSSLKMNDYFNDKYELLVEGKQIQIFEQPVEQPA